MVGLFLGLMMVSIVPILIASMTRTELIRRRPLIHRRPLIRRRALIRRQPPIHRRSIIHRRPQPIYEDVQPSLQQDPIMSLEAAAGSRTARPIDDDSKGRCPIDDSELRCPVHLPWGDCMIIKDNTGRMIIKVPGRYDGINHTSTSFPVIMRSAILG